MRNGLISACLTYKFSSFSLALSFEPSLVVCIFTCVLIRADLGAAPSQSKTDDDAASNAGNWWETAEAIKLEYADHVKVRARIHRD